MTFISFFISYLHSALACSLAQAINYVVIS